MAIHSYTERRYLPSTRKWDRETKSTVEIPAREIVIEIMIDTRSIAARMAASAASNKSKTARQIGGAVIVRLMGEKTIGEAV